VAGGICGSCLNGRAASNANFCDCDPHFRTGDDGFCVWCGAGFIERDNRCVECPASQTPIPGVDDCEADPGEQNVCGLGNYMLWEEGESCIRSDGACICRSYEECNSVNASCGEVGVQYARASDRHRDDLLGRCRVVICPFVPTPADPGTP
jgi:hypothetical protein